MTSAQGLEIHNFCAPYDLLNYFLIWLSHALEFDLFRNSLQEEYILKWRDYQSNFFELAEDLFVNELLTDVTICCRDQAGPLACVVVGSFDLVFFFRQVFLARNSKLSSQCFRCDRRRRSPIVNSRQTFEAHRLVLSVCSTYFRSVFTSAQLRQRGGQGHPVIFIKVECG